MKRLYLDSSAVIDMMKFELEYKRKSNKKNDKLIVIENNIKSLNKAKSKYQLTISTIALGEVVRYILENGKGEKYFRWLHNFLNDYEFDVLPITRDTFCKFDDKEMKYKFDDETNIFKIAEKIVSNEFGDQNEWWGGKTLDGNDALILAQAILDEHDEALILTCDRRMLEATTPHDIIEEMEIHKKLRIINDLGEI